MAVAKVFFDTPMVLGLPGLNALAAERKVRPGGGRFVMFMNRKRTKVKILFDQNTMFSYSKAGGGVISLEELAELPLICSGPWFEDKITSTLDRWLKTPLTQRSDLVRAS